MTFFWIAAVVAAYFIGKKIGVKSLNQMNDKTSEAIQNSLKDNEELKSFPTGIKRGLHYSDLSQDASSIYKMVEEKKQQAKEKGLPKFVILMFEECKNYPSWINRTPRGSVPPEVITAKKSNIEAGSNKTSSDIWDMTELQLEKGRFTFLYKSSSEYAKLSLKWNDTLVITLGLHTENFERWSCYSVDAYVSGEWEEELLKFKNAIERNNMERESQKKENPEVLEDLKKNFGI